MEIHKAVQEMMFTEKIWTQSSTHWLQLGIVMFTDKIINEIETDNKMLMDSFFYEAFNMHYNSK